MRRLSPVLAALAAFLLASAPAVAAPADGTLPEQAGPKKEKPLEVKLLAFNDFHGNLEPPAGTISGVPAGGVEYFATHIEMLRAKNPHTFVVSAGDLIGASPLLSGLFHDEPTIEAMNLIGLDYNGVGNHEFDEGKDELLRMQYGGCHPVDGCQDGVYFYGSIFQFLAANVIDDSTGNPLLPSYEIVNVRGTKIAFIGETLEGTPRIVTPSGVAGLTFLDEADTVNMLVPRLQQMQVETIVLLLHQGGSAGGGINGCNNLGGAITGIVDRLDPAVDVVISGHTHNAYNCVRSGKIVTSASAFGRLITEVDLTIDRRTGDVVDGAALNRIVTRDVPPDPRLTALLDHYREIAGPIANRVVGSITADITRSNNNDGESTLGNLIADAQLAATRETDFGGSVVAFMNRGGIRADILYGQISGGEQPGEVTYGELFTVQPFANTLVVKTFTGEQLKRLLEQQWQGGAGIMQVSEGFEYSYSTSRPLGSRVDPDSIKINGVTVDPSAAYRVTMNSFMADGGDGYTVFTEGTDQLGGEVDLDALARYFTENSPISPSPRGRITRE